jgi:hypothetical protein
VRETVPSVSKPYPVAAKGGQLCERRMWRGAVGAALLALVLLAQHAAGSAEECEPCQECAGCVDCFDDERCGPCAGCEPCYTADGGVNTTVDTCTVCIGCEFCSRCGSCDEFGCREQCAGCACYWRVKRCQREPCVSCSLACTKDASTPGCDPGCASCGDCSNCYDCHDCTCCTGCKFCIDAGYAPCPTECGSRSCHPPRTVMP